jgi:hypothetical protein
MPRAGVFIGLVCVYAAADFVVSLGEDGALRWRFSC